MRVNSADLVLYHYKEPLKRVVGGFGYYGAVTVTKDDTGVQCHICGEVFSTLDHHIRSRHKTTTRQYKDRFQLAGDTALISEKVRNRLIDASKKHYESHTAAEKQRIKQLLIDGRWGFQRQHGSGMKGISLETRNKRGTCPDQILDKIKEVKERLGHVPSKQDFINDQKSIRYIHLIYKVYGSWAKALKLCHFEQKERPTTHKYRRYTREHLIEYLKLFQLEHNRIPAASDCRRGFLPDHEVFKRKFGNFQQARVAAGIHEPMRRKQLSPQYKLP